MIVEAWRELAAYSIPELVAVLASLAYIVLAARNNRYCWPAAFVGSCIFVVVLWQYRLLMDSALNVYYALMAIYGWLLWNRASSSSNTGSNTRSSISDNTGSNSGNDTDITTGNEFNTTAAIQRLTLAQHVFALMVIATLSLGSGYWLAYNSDAAFPYLDSLTTWASLFATWLLAKRALENWLYWIAIDALSIYLYLNKGLLFTTLLFIVYVLMAVYGYHFWRRQYHLQNNVPGDALPRYSTEAADAAG